MLFLTIDAMIIGLGSTIAVGPSTTANGPNLAQTLPPPVQLTRQYWGTIYYAWYGHWTHWNERAHNPPTTWASMYLPDDGSGVYKTQNLYNSMNTTVLNGHLIEMDRARLDFALVSWWGQGSGADQALRLVLQRASSNSSLHLKLGIYYEPEGTTDPTVSQIVSDLTYIYDQYSASSAFFKVSDGTRQYPVVFVYGGNDNLNYTDRWAQARAQMYMLGKPVFITLKVWATATDTWRNHSTMVDSWHQYAPAQQYQFLSGYSAFASPGYWEYPELATARGRANPYQPLLVRNSTNFANAVKSLASLSVTQAQFLLIETFNEFHEGSMIEPAIQINHNDQSGFSQAKPSYGFTYIDIVRNRGTNPPPPPSNHPPSLQQIPTKTIDELTRMTFTVSGTDTDGDMLTYSANGLPSDASFDPSTRTFDWTPSESQGPGDYTINFTVTDNGSPRLSSSETLLIHVLEANTPPILESIRDYSVENGTLISFKANAADTDIPAQSLRFSLLNPPSGASISTEGQFVWDTSNAGSGIYVIAVNASDGSLTRTVQFRVTVVVPQPPLQPQIEPPATTVGPASPGVFSLTTASLLPAIIIVATVLFSSLFLSRRRGRQNKTSPDTS